MPDDLLIRAKQEAAERRTTLIDMVTLSLRREFGLDCIGDFNGDGLSDIAFAHHNLGGQGLVIDTKLSNGDRTFSSIEDVVGNGIGVWNNGNQMVGEIGRAQRKE